MRAPGIVLFPRAHPPSDRSSSRCGWFPTRDAAASFTIVVGMGTRWRQHATREQHAITAEGFRESCDRAIKALQRLRSDAPELAGRLGDYERGWPSASPGTDEGG